MQPYTPQRHMHPAHAILLGTFRILLGTALTTYTRRITPAWPIAPDLRVHPRIPPHMPFFYLPFLPATAYNNLFSYYNCADHGPPRDTANAIASQNRYHHYAPTPPPIPPPTNTSHGTTRFSACGCLKRRRDLRTRRPHPPLVTSPWAWISLVDEMTCGQPGIYTCWDIFIAARRCQCLRCRNMGHYRHLAAARTCYKDIAPLDEDGLRVR